MPLRFAVGDIDFSKHCFERLGLVEVAKTHMARNNTDQHGFIFVDGNERLGVLVVPVPGLKQEPDLIASLVRHAILKLYDGRVFAPVLFRIDRFMDVQGIGIKGSFFVETSEIFLMHKIIAELPGLDIGLAFGSQRLFDDLVGGDQVLFKQKS